MMDGYYLETTQKLYLELLDKLYETLITSPNAFCRRTEDRVKWLSLARDALKLRAEVKEWFVNAVPASVEFHLRATDENEKQD